LWRIDPLLGKDLETNERKAVAVQRRGKHNSITIIAVETVFSTRSVQKNYKEDNWGEPVSWQLDKENAGTGNKMLKLGGSQAYKRSSV
jgi:hypothetical protein